MDSIERRIPKMSEAMGGRRQAHMDVLVAVFGIEDSTPASQRTKARKRG